MYNSIEDYNAIISLDEQCSRIIDFHTKYILKDKFSSIKKFMIEDIEKKGNSSFNLIAEALSVASDKSFSSHLVLGTLFSNNLFKSNIVILDSNRITSRVFANSFLNIDSLIEFRFNPSFSHASIKITFQLKNYIIYISTDDLGEFYFSILHHTTPVSRKNVDKEDMSEYFELGRAFFNLNINLYSINNPLVIDKIHEIVNGFIDLINTNKCESFTELFEDRDRDNLIKWIHLFEMSDI